VHERIRLSVIARDKAEALHRVEKLDRAGRLFARQLALRRGRLGRNCDHITHNLEIGCRNFATAIDEVEFKLLAFCQTFETSALHGADVDKHVLTTIFTLDKAEALLRIEEFDDAFASADNLRGHAASAARTTGSAWAAEAAAAATRSTATTEAAAITAAKSAAVTTATEAAAITAAKTTTTATATSAAAKAAAIKPTAETAATAAATAVGIETTFVTETIALVASATPPPSVKTHKNQ
jgi:hypothetical protein